MQSLDREVGEVAWVWGVGMLTEAVLRLSLIYLLPLDSAVGATTALMFAVMGCLAAWTVRLTSRLPPLVESIADVQW